MTIRQLITELSKYPQDMEVVIAYQRDYDSDIYIRQSIEKVEKMTGCDGSEIWIEI